MHGKASSSGKIKSDRKERKKKAKESKLTYAEIKTRERRKLWAHIVKKVLPNELCNWNFLSIRL